METLLRWMEQKLWEYSTTEMERELHHLEMLWFCWTRTHKGDLEIYRTLYDRLDQLYPRMTAEQRQPWEERGKALYEAMLCLGVQHEELADTVKVLSLKYQAVYCT